MTLTRSKKSLLLFLIGFLFVVLDININTGISYPQDYDNSQEVIGEFQYYNIKSTYGASCTYKMIIPNEDNSSSSSTVASGSTGTKVIDKVFYSKIHFDIFNDAVGFILIILASLLLKSGSRKFNYSIITSVFSVILHCTLFILPFILNGIILCDFVFVTGFAYIFCGIIATFFYTKGLFNLARGVVCRDERKWIQITWYITVVALALTTFVNWLGSDYAPLIGIGYFFTIVMICLIVLYYILSQRFIDYVEESYNDIVNQ